MNVDFCINKYSAEYISSRSNPKVVAFSKLSDKKYRDEQGLYLAEGVKLAAEALKYADVDRIIVSTSAVELNDKAIEVITLADEKDVDIIVMSDSAFEKISTEKSPQGIIAVVKYNVDAASQSDFKVWQEDKRLIFLDGIRDPGNLGTIIRSAEALGITGVILHDCADLYNGKTIRGAMGSVFRMPVYVSRNGVETVQSLKQSGRRVLGAALGEHNLILGQYDALYSDCPVIGNEGHGISADILRECDACLMIPMAGKTESLNAAQAATCILWEYHRTK